MIIDRNGNILDAVKIPDGATIFDCFRVRVIRETINTHSCTSKKEVVGEEDFQVFPSDEQIMYCIAKHKGDFATVEKIYSIQIVPFA